MTTTEPLGGNLQQLITERIGPRSYTQLSRDCGGVPGKQRIQQIMSNSQPMKQFPEVAAILGLARGLSVTVTHVIMASARSLGLEVGGIEEGAMLIARANELPDDEQELIIGVARSLISLHDDLAEKDIALAQALPPAEDNDSPSLAKIEGGGTHTEGVISPSGGPTQNDHALAARRLSARNRRSNGKPDSP